MMKSMRNSRFRKYGSPDLMNALITEIVMMIVTTIGDIVESMMMITLQEGTNTMTMIEIEDTEERMRINATLRRMNKDISQKIQKKRRADTLQTMTMAMTHLLAITVTMDLKSALTIKRIGVMATTSTLTTTLIPMSPAQLEAKALAITKFLKSFMLMERRLKM